jgi:hypothetical protein
MWRFRKLYAKLVQQGTPNHSQQSADMGHAFRYATMQVLLLFGVSPPSCFSDHYLAHQTNTLSIASCN